MLRLRNRQDADAWCQFVEIYAPLIYGLARKRGLQDADAADVTQDVLRVVCSSIGKLDYDPHCDSFRGWLFTVVRTKLHDLVARLQRAGPAAGDVAVQQLLDQQPATDEDSDFWNRQYEQQVFVWASDQVQSNVEPATWQAFWKTAIEDQPSQAVADELGMSVASVYVAKSRVIARLREQVQHWMNNEAS